MTTTSRADAAHSGSALERSTSSVQAGLTRLRAGVFLTDAVCVLVALVAAQVVRFGNLRNDQLVGSDLRYASVSALIGMVWLLCLVLRETYHGHKLGHGPREFIDVIVATLQVFSIAALISFALRYDLARGYVLVALPLGLVLLSASHLFWRTWLVRRRRRGELCLSVLVIGDAERIEQLVEATAREPGSGFSVVAICSDDPRSTIFGSTLLGREASAVEVAEAGQFDIVAWAGSRSSSDSLRRLGWSLENSRSQLVVLPGLTDIAGPRVTAQPVSGLPLLYVERPVFSGSKLVVKTVMDYVLAALLMVALMPVWAVVSLLIKAQDGGPVFYRQTRVGQNSREFTIWKFRTMKVGADRLEAELRESAHDGAGPMFKERQDARITRVGRVLRRYSLDETPQLINVLRGDMSLVGPRPPLPHEAAQYEDDVRRRLLVRPGATGLWQVAGRSDLSWSESVRLDLYYVENWSMLGDLAILWRTLGAVAFGRGAY